MKKNMTTKRKLVQALLTALLILTFVPTAAFAADALTAISNLSTFMFSVIKGIGAIILGFGIVQVGLALKSHDASQRANGFLTVAGGIIILFAQEILKVITG